MRKLHSAALLAMVWYLMLPPPVMPPVKEANGSYKVNSKAPVSQWLVLKTMPSKGECKAELKKVAKFYRCISSDDPRLKMKKNPSPPAAAAPAPPAAPAPAPKAN